MITKEEERAMWRRNSLRYIHKVHFGGLRDDVLRRDGFMCVKCGMTREGHRDKFGIDITIDHIDRDRTHNELGNLQTLCCICHGSKDNVHGIKTHCLRGHKFDDKNTRVSRGWRNCRQCAEIYRVKSEAKLKKAA